MYHITISDSEFGTLLDQDVEKFVIIRRVTKDDEAIDTAVRINTRGWSANALLGIATWWQRTLTDALIAGNEQAEPLADDDVDGAPFD